MKVLGIIPARGGSKGIPRKNIRTFAGKPLLAWTAEAALASMLDRVILSSEDEEIVSLGRILGLDVPFTRPAELAGDTAASIDVVLHAVKTLEEKEGYRPDAIMLLQPTSPLRRTKHIDESIDLLSRDAKANSLVSVVKAPHNMIPESLMRFNDRGYIEPLLSWDSSIHQRQNKPVYYARNGAAIYLVRTDTLYKTRTLYGEKIIAYEMSKEDSVDIDDSFDWNIAEFLMANRIKIK